MSVDHAVFAQIHSDGYDWLKSINLLLHFISDIKNGSESLSSFEESEYLVDSLEQRLELLF